MLIYNWGYPHWRLQNPWGLHFLGQWGRAWFLVNRDSRFPPWLFRWLYARPLGTQPSQTWRVVQLSKCSTGEHCFFAIHWRWASWVGWLLSIPCVLLCWLLSHMHLTQEAAFKASSHRYSTIPSYIRTRSIQHTRSKHLKKSTSPPIFQLGYKF